MDPKIIREISLAYEAVYDKNVQSELSEAEFKWDPNKNIIASKGGKLGIMTKGDPKSWREPSEQEKGEIPVSSTKSFEKSASGKKFIQQRDASKASKLASTAATKPSPSSTTSKPASSTTKSAEKLTPMQQWAKAHPNLASKVKVGQSGYDEISKMRDKPGPNEKQDQTPTQGSPTSKIDPQSVKSDLQKANAPKSQTSSSPTTTTSSSTGSSLQQKIRSRRLNMNFDLFDIVKGHLLDEGYADTEEAALVIMVNMSEEWKQSIIDEMAMNPNSRFTTAAQRKEYSANQIGSKEFSDRGGYAAMKAGGGQAALKKGSSVSDVLHAGKKAAATKAKQDFANKLNRPSVPAPVKKPMDDFAAGGGAAKMKKTGMTKDQVIALGKKNLATKPASKPSSAPSQPSGRVVGSTPSDVVRDRQDSTERRREFERKAMAAGKSPVGYQKMLDAQAQEKRYNDWEKSRPKPTGGYKGLAG